MLFSCFLMLSYATVATVSSRVTSGLNAFKVRVPAVERSPSTKNVHSAVRTVNRRYPGPARLSPRGWTSSEAVCEPCPGARARRAAFGVGARNGLSFCGNGATAPDAQAAKPFDVNVLQACQPT